MTSRPRWILPFLCALAILVPRSRGDDRQGPAEPKAGGASGSRVYGEWRIRVRPDQGPAYNRLIEQSGLPLFRGAGGRMVGWWNTLVGDLYEQVTLWEYDDMAAFERAIQTLSKDPAFARFVAARDPLLAGEESRFLRLAPAPYLQSCPISTRSSCTRSTASPCVRRDDYLAYMTGQGLGLLKAHGFRPVGPWVVEVGRWTEVTYLFRFDSLAERERLIARFSATGEGLRLCREGRRVRRGGHDAAPHPVDVREAGARQAGADGRRAAASRGAGARRLRGRLLRQAALGQLRMGRAAGGDPADRRPPRHPGARVPGDGRRDHRQARADAGGDPGPRRRRGDRAGPPRQGGRSRGGLTGDSRAAGAHRSRSRAQARAALDRAHPDRRHVGRGRVPADGWDGRRGGCRRVPAGPVGPVRRTARRARPARPAAGQRHRAVGGGPAAARGPRAVAGGAGFGIVGRARRPGPASSVPGRAPPTGRLRDRPGPASRRPARAGPAPRRVLRLDALRHPDRRGPRPRLPRADRARRPVPRSAARSRRIPGRMPWS